MSRLRRGVQKKVEPGAPAWMNTYGDMVTLVLTMFVLLYAFSTLDAKKWQQFVASFGGKEPVVTDDNGGLYPPPAMTPQPTQSEPPEHSPGNIPTQEADQKFEELYRLIARHIVDQELEVQLGVEKSDDVITLHIRESALFDSGKDVIRPDAQQLIDNISEILRRFSDYIRTIRIEGHTDNVPIHTSKFVSNWALSTYRAVNVVEYLVGVSGMRPEQFSAVGYGEYRPIDTNDTQAGRAHNRRVDFVIESVNKD